jgi:hypothetical protein
MIACYTSPLFALLLLYNLIPIVSTTQPLKCWGKFSDSDPLDFNDCRGAVDMIPSGGLSFNGGGPRDWVIEAKGHRYKSLPAMFTYRTCSIDVGKAFEPHPNPRPPNKMAQAIYHQVWPPVKAAAERLLEQCVATNQQGRTYALVTMNETYFLFSVEIDRTSRFERSRVLPKHHHYIGGEDDEEPAPPAPPAPPQAKKPWWKGFKGCVGCSSGATLE